jgi:hypothetical protein
LSPLLPLFPRGQRDAPLDQNSRRGAAADRFGNWYWIGSDRRTLYWSPAATRRAALYWSQDGAAPQLLAGAFHSHPRPPSPAELSGLAVTEHHYLVVGSLTDQGVFIFDLHSGGEPLLLQVPAPAAFVPYDMAPAPGGGVWILDRHNRALWGLDRYFTLLGEALTPQAVEQPAFHPPGEPAQVSVAHPRSRGYPLDAQDPVSLECLPDGSLLILDYRLGVAPSHLYHFRPGQTNSAPIALPQLAGAVAGDQSRPLAGHDMAYLPDRQVLYLVERDGNQAIAFDLPLAGGPGSPPAGLELRREYLPMHFFGGRALVAWEGGVYYDIAARQSSRDAVVRWVELHAIDQPRYVRQAELLTPVFDGRQRGLTWHRLFLEACLPSETAVEVWTRAGEDPDLLLAQPFVQEPPLYLRRGGSEIPYYQPATGRFVNDLPVPGDGEGTWELLFQQAIGRYLQIKLVLKGNGRTTPELQALRAYYPRFSYVKNYLPAVYQDDPESAWFLERFLANMEGFYSELEGKIAAAGLLFDARSAPPQALEWLGGWVGLVLDPLWERIQARRIASLPAASRQHAQGRPPFDRRRLFVRFARRLYDRRGTPDGLRFALHLLLDPCLEIMLERLKAASVRLDLGLQLELDRLGLLYPSPSTSDSELEDILFYYLLAPDRPSKVRIVERFRTRQGRALVAGDPTTPQSAVEQSFADSAHRFSVLIPETLSPEEAAMVERIVRLEKPAHTRFDVRRYWDYFRVGEARLGLDTVLGEEARFLPIILGRDYLAEGYLSPAPPMDTADRLVADRDRLGELSIYGPFRGKPL